MKVHRYRQPLTRCRASKQVAIWLSNSLQFPQRAIKRPWYRLMTVISVVGLRDSNSWTRLPSLAAAKTSISKVPPSTFVKTISIPITSSWSPSNLKTYSTGPKGETQNYKLSQVPENLSAVGTTTSSTWHLALLPRDPGCRRGLRGS